MEGGEKERERERERGQGKTIYQPYSASLANCTISVNIKHTMSKESVG